ncbi:hypothetical protein [Streptomyces sp. AcH 505]|uniref:hypothetical protein n=1 Tax=Streptomyces sp. AcH 505 TaxID=352211 RepID=UPI0005AB87A0
MRRSASRLPRILACAAVPVMLVVAGCSSGSDDKSDADGPSKTSSSQPSPSVAPAKFSTLPDACKTVGAKTIGSLVPKAKSKSGTQGKSTDVATRGACSWNGLDDNGVKGSQYRWLDVSLMRYDSDVTVGSGASRAGKFYAEEIADAQGTVGAKSVKTAAAAGIGDQASTVTYTLKKTGEDFSYATVVARTENVVVTLTYNGAGYAGAKSPSVADVSKDAAKAAKEAVASISGGSAAADSGSGSGTGSGSGHSPAPGKSSSEKPSKPSSSTSPKPKSSTGDA